MRRALADSFGNVADLYERVRLPYSDAAVERLCAELGLGGSEEVLDLAAGTGKLTRALAPRFRRVVAVEPNRSMRGLIDAAEAVEGSAESIPLADASFDAVFVGDAFHWFARPDVLEEIARVLRPRGGLALVWNHWWETEPSVPDAARRLLDARFEQSGGLGIRNEEDWRAAFPGSPFAPLAEDTLHERIEVDGSRLVDLYLTTSSFAVLPAGERAVLEAELRALVQGRFAIPVQARLAWTRLAA